MGKSAFRDGEAEDERNHQCLQAKEKGSHSLLRGSAGGNGIRGRKTGKSVENRMT